MYTGYRASEQYYEHDMTAQDVVDHETDELGNELDLMVLYEELASIPMRRVTWICATQQDARRYGDDIVEVIYKRVLARDNEQPQGYLVELA